MISSQTAKAAFTLTGTNQVLNFAFTILASEDIEVTATTAAGVDSTLTINTHYTVDVSGQTVTMIGGTATDVISVYRATPHTQAASGSFNAQFPAAGYQASLDRLVLQIQKLSLATSRSLRFPNSNVVAPSLTKTGRAGKILGFDADGAPTFYTATVPVVSADLVIEVSAISEMTALAVGDLVTGRQCSVLGYTAAGDGGGGVFHYSSTSTTTANSGTVFAPDAGAGRWKRVLESEGMCNVRHFGATGLGVVTDTAAIGLAIAALPTNYGHLYFPAGIYLLATSPTAFASKNYLTVSGQSAVINNTSDGNSFVFNSTCSKVDVMDLYFTGDSTVRGSGIHIRIHCDDVTVDNCYFEGCSDFGLFIGHDDSSTRCARSSVTNCIFFETLGDGVHVMNASDVVIDGNVFYSTGDDAVGIVADVSTVPPYRVTVSDNSIYDGKSRGIVVLEGIDVVVSNNNIFGTVASAIEVGRANSTSAYNHRVLIQGNKIYNSTSTAGPRGAIQLNYANQGHVIGNVIENTLNGAAISFLDVQFNTICDNRIRVAASRGIVSDDSTTTNVATAWNNLLIKGNMISGITANQSIFIDPAAGITLTDLIVDGNTGMDLPAGAWIYYTQVTTGRIANNTNLQSRAVSAGGSVTSVTAHNNN